jgi:chorismate mutase
MIQTIKEILNKRSITVELPVIAGPCSAESEEQVLDIARSLAKNPHVIAFRAGVWKPRTRPGSFEGIGSPALKWLQLVKQETGLPSMVEVANTYHVEEALAAGIDYLWIGARTTVNPFYVQEIANALRGVDIPVMVKNPIHPELGLWLGALERLSKTGNDRLIAVHRGFYTSMASAFRNDPKWEMAVEFKAQMPHIPLLCDPSHITGNRNFIQEVSQAALDLNFDGLMIETHNRPDHALSDAAQQITPERLSHILQNLVLKSEDCEDELTQNRLGELRSKIDGLDDEILQLIAQRKKLVEAIGEVKYDNNISILQFKRWFSLIKDRRGQSKDLNLDDKFILELFQLIHKFSINTQQDLMQAKSKNESISL